MTTVDCLPTPQILFEVYVYVCLFAVCVFPVCMCVFDLN